MEDGRSKRRVHDDHVMSALERTHRSLDRASSIDDQIDEALTKIDWDRRRKAEASFYSWVCTYGYPSLLQTLPPDNAKTVLDKMEESLKMTKPLQIQLHRGCGKSVYCQLFLLYQICTLKRRYPVIISANARAGNQLLTDIFRFIVETDTPFAQDYPTLHLPFAICNGSYRRRQIYRDRPTNISKTASDLSFGDLDIDGQPKACHISARGITSGLRGMRKGSIRVDSILLDDLLGDDDVSEEATVKLLDIIHKSVLNLGGANYKINCTMTSTPIAPDDLTQRIKTDKNWSTVCYPAIINWGKIDSPEWVTYWDMYDAESVEDKPHTESDEYYKEHQQTLEDGFTLYNPDCYTASENISGVQALMQRRHLIGEDAFACEYQLQPKRYSIAIEVTAQDVLSKIGTTPMLTAPEGTQMIVSSWDLNVSHCLTNSIVAFDSRMTGTVLYHEVYKCRIPSTLPETEYQQRVYNLLTEYGKRVASLGLKIDYLGIDAGGANFNSVCDWVKHSSNLCGLKAAAFVGRSSHVWSDSVRSRLRSATGRAILCGDEAEHLRAGSGRKWVAWDADVGKSQVLKAIKVAPYGIGGLMLYNGSTRDHQEYATQVTNERLLYVQHQSSGKDVYHWKSKSAIDHDYLDTLAQAYAIAWTNSLGTEVVQTQSPVAAKVKAGLLKRPIRRKLKLF